MEEKKEEEKLMGKKAGEKLDVDLLQVALDELRQRTENIGSRLTSKEIPIRVNVEQKIVEKKDVEKIEGEKRIPEQRTSEFRKENIKEPIFKLPRLKIPTLKKEEIKKEVKTELKREVKEENPSVAPIFSRPFILSPVQESKSKAKLELKPEIKSPSKKISKRREDGNLFPEVPQFIQVSAMGSMPPRTLLENYANRERFIPPAIIPNKKSEVNKIDNPVKMNKTKKETIKEDIPIAEDVGDIREEDHHKIKEFFSIGKNMNNKPALDNQEKFYKKIKEHVRLSEDDYIMSQDSKSKFHNYSELDPALEKHVTNDSEREIKETKKIKEVKQTKEIREKKTGKSKTKYFESHEFLNIVNNLDEVKRIVNHNLIGLNRDLRVIKETEQLENSRVDSNVEELKKLISRLKIILPVVVE